MLTAAPLAGRIGRTATLVVGSVIAALATLGMAATGNAVVAGLPDIREMLLRNLPAPPRLASKAFAYLALCWLLVGAGIVSHVAAGITVLFVLLLTLLQLGAPVPTYGWVDLLLAAVAGWVVARWMPRTVAA